LGFTPEFDLSTVNFFETHPAWAAQLLRDEAIPYAIEHETWSGETALLGPDGLEIPVLQVIIAHKCHDGASAYLSTIVRDITKRKQVEANLAGQLEELRRWHDTTMGRELRILDLKHEVNELLGQAGQPPRYPSAESQNQTEA
jgi:hypothetical protein